MIVQKFKSSKYYEVSRIVSQALRIKRKQTQGTQIARNKASEVAKHSSQTTGHHTASTLKSTAVAVSSADAANGKGQSRYGAHKIISEFQTTRESADSKENRKPANILGEAAAKVRVSRGSIIRTEDLEKASRMVERQHMASL